MSEGFLVPQGVEDLHAEDIGGGQGVLLSLTTADGAFAGQLSSLQSAQLGLYLLQWLAEKAVETPEQVLRPPLMARELRFEAGAQPRSIVLAVDLGTAVARFEVTHAQLGEALAQLNGIEGAPASPN